MTFRVGMKVICIANGMPLEGETDADVGSIYTIRGIVKDAERCGLHLQEITNPPQLTSIGFIERGLTATRFRPVVSRKTDISQLQALLVPGAKILEDAR